MESIRKNNYMVMVNGKFMVKVQHDGSACDAEHEIFDNFDGIQASQAFAWDDMETEFFRDNLMMCEFITMDDLKKMSDEYETNWKKVVKTKEATVTACHEVERLQKELENAKKALDDALVAQNNAYLHAMHFQCEVMGVQSK